MPCGFTFRIPFDIADLLAGDGQAGGMARLTRARVPASLSKPRAECPRYCYARPIRRLGRFPTEYPASFAFAAFVEDAVSLAG